MASTTTNQAADPAVAANAAPTAAALAASAQANIAPATTFNTSGAPVQIVPDVDPGQPAVDDNPRAGTTVRQNRIDFNDPTISGAEAAAQMLADQKPAATTDKAKA